jgi:Na+-translocating ferredoxin:NAD+ oxidoreductase RnfD subunit
MKTPVSNVKVKYETLVIIWGALLVSQLMFLGLIYALKPELFSSDFSQLFFGEHPIVTILFAAAAIAVFILSFVLRNQHIRRSVIDQDAGCVQTALVLGCALSEICSVLGVVLAFVFDYQYFFVWIALGFIGVLLHFPRRQTLDAAGDNRL